MENIKNRSYLYGGRILYYGFKEYLKAAALSVEEKDEEMEERENGA